MKKNEIKELKNKSAGELESIVRESGEKMRTLRFDLAAGKVKNVYELHENYKKIARAKTFLRQQELQAPIIEVTQK
jgi:large subunit ribosomal protein L29